MQKLFEPLAGYPPFLEIKKAMDSKQHAAAYDVSEGQRAYLACALSSVTGRQVLYIAPSWQAAVRAADDCSQLLPGRAGALPAPETQFARATASRETDWQRIEMLTLAQSGTLAVLCAPADAILFRCMPPAKYKAQTITVRAADRLMPQDLIARLARIGYERVDMVEGKGQCALRGDIVDVFPPCGQDALRVEFFDDEVDNMRLFDPISQRSLNHTQEEQIPPATEYLLDKSECRDAAMRLRTAVMAYVATHPADPLSAALPPLPEDDGDENAPKVPAAHHKGFLRLLEDADMVASGGLLHNAGMLSNILLPVSGTLLDWLDDPIVIMDSPDHIRTRCEDRKMGFAEELQLALTRREALPAQENLLLDYNDVLDALKKHTVLTLQEFLRGMSGITPGAVIRFPGIGATRYQNNTRDLAKDVLTWQREKYTVRLLSGGVARGQRLRTALSVLGASLPVIEDDTADIPQAAILPFTLSRGFVMTEARLAFLSDSDLYGAGYRKARSVRNAGERIEAFTDLKEGDFVVHEHHGVGIFQGTVRLQSEGTYRDYLYIQYRGNDKLYVPVDQFDRVQKYIGGQDTPPTLNQLGGGEWQKQKKRVKAGLKKLAIDLVALYAARKAVPGHAFAKDSPWQAQFEDNFPYELTPDQLRAVRDITRDMESTANMDRLICGDVGYGKTEVALRAAFKAVMDGKQVAILAPTTILAQQHYYTIQKRFEDFPVTVGVLSRFSSAKAQKETLARPGCRQTGHPGGDPPAA